VLSSCIMFSFTAFFFCCTCCTSGAGGRADSDLKVSSGLSNNQHKPNSKKAQSNQTKALLNHVFLNFILHFTASIYNPRNSSKTFSTSVFPDHALELLKVSMCLHVLLPESTLNLKNSNGMRLQCSGTDYRPTATDGWIGKESGSRQF